LKSEIIRRVVETARKQSHIVNDEKFSFLKKAKVGSPIMVYTTEGEPTFWLVPLMANNLACGFAQVELSSQVSKIGIFGSTPNDSQSWIKASFFKEPPSEILTEIQSVFSEDTISEPVFSFDISPARWAWMLKIKSKNNTTSVIFITPGGWYKRI
jgi:hypothetical protein